MSDQTNIVRIKAVYNALEELRDQVVFVGGATVALYADRLVIDPRPTDDVDILVEIATRADYILLEEKLRSKGFKTDTSSKFVGRFIINNLQVDVMPTLADILGFSNFWYKEGMDNAISYRIDELCTVRIFSAAYFIASKLEAFKTRGKNNDGDLDGRTSADFEDIVFVLEHRSKIWEDFNNCPDRLKQYLKTEFRKLNENPFFEEWVDGYAGYGSPPFTYIIMDNLQKFIE